MAIVTRENVEGEIITPPGAPSGLTPNVKIVYLPTLKFNEQKDTVKELIIRNKFKKERTNG